MKSWCLSNSLKHNDIKWKSNQECLSKILQSRFYIAHRLKINPVLIAEISRIRTVFPVLSPVTRLIHKKMSQLRPIFIFYCNIRRKTGSPKDKNAPLLLIIYTRVRDNHHLPTFSRQWESKKAAKTLRLKVGQPRFYKKLQAKSDFFCPNAWSVKKKPYLCTAFERKRLQKCGNSSVGRAQPCQGWGREFESRFPLTF